MADFPQPAAAPPDARALYRRGFLVTLLGVMAITPDTLLVKLIEADAWTVLFWRSLLVGIGLAALHGFEAGFDSLPRALYRTGRPGIWIVLGFGGSNLLFVTALTLTTAAEVLVVLAAAPLIAALLGVAVLRERAAPRLWVGAVGVAAGVGIVFAGGMGAGGVAGTLAALGAGLAFATYLTAVRAAGPRPVLPAAALGSVLGALVVLPWASPASPSAADWLFLVLNGLVVMPVAFGLISIGPRYLPAPEVALMMLLEAVIGPVWVWLALGELPSRETVAGGAVILAAVAGTAALGFRRRRPRSTP